MAEDRTTGGVQSDASREYEAGRRKALRSRCDDASGVTGLRKVGELPGGAGRDVVNKGKESAGGLLGIRSQHVPEDTLGRVHVRDSWMTGRPPGFIQLVLLRY